MNSRKILSFAIILVMNCGALSAATQDAAHSDQPIGRAQSPPPIISSEPNPEIDKGDTGNLLINGNFSDGLNGWSVWIEEPTTTVQVVPSDGVYTDVLDINNPVSDSEGDWD